MKKFIATGDSTFKVEETVDSNKSLIKVRLSQIMPTISDFALFDGKIPKEKPIVPCHLATAILSDDCESLGLKRGSKVLLSPYATKNNDGNYSNSLRYGYEIDGFLADFVTVSEDTVIPLIEGIKENEAIFAEIIAVAMETVKAVDLKKGDYVAIIGGTLLNNIIAQLALYYQAIPILIDNRAESIKIADKCGVYYVIDESTEDPYQRVLEITGGRLADHTIIHAKANCSSNLLFRLAKVKGNCVITSVNDYISRIVTDVSLIASKQLKVKGVTTGANEFVSAINILAQKILKLEILIDKYYRVEEIDAAFSEMAKEPLKYFAPIIKM